MKTENIVALCDVDHNHAGHTIKSFPDAKLYSDYREMLDKQKDIDAVLIATPEFNGSIPGVLKNALDWASRPFPGSSLTGKPVAVMGASTGLFGAAWAQAEVRKVLGVIGADVIDGELPIGQADGAFADDGELLDPDQRTVLADLVMVLTERAGSRAAAAAV